MNCPNLNTVCRLCLDESVILSVFDINQTYLSHKILACLGIEVKQNDKMSKMLCKHCYTKVEECYKFRNSCQKTQFILMNCVHTGENVQNSLSNTVKEESFFESETMDEDLVLIKQESSEYEHLQYEYVDVLDTEPDSYYTNNIQPVTDETLAMIEQDSLLIPSAECPSTSHGIEIPPEVCRTCGKQFSSVHNRTRHEKTVHQVLEEPKEAEPAKIIEKPEKIKEIENTEGIKCRFCGNIFMNNYNRIRHEKTIHKDAKNYCKICNKIFSTSGNKIKHEKMVHTRRRIEKWRKVLPKKSLPTQIIEKRKIFHNFKIETEEDFTNFYTIIYECIRSRICICCKEYNPSRKSLTAHLKKLFLTDLHYNCWKCWVSFPNMSQYRTHMLNNQVCDDRYKNLLDITLGFKRYQNLQCLLCEFILSDETEYKFHLIKHKPVVFPLNCLICNIQIDDLQSFEQHYESSCIKRIFCGICKNSFLTEQDFLSHCNLHQDITNLTFEQKLAECFKPTDKPPLDNIPSENSEEFNFSCRLCQKGFQTQILMLKHLSIYHKDTSIVVCKLCNDKDINKYVLKDEYNNHVEKNHNEIENNFSCNICGSLFSTLDQWREHQKCHEETFDCENCDENFKNTNDLDEHRKTHGHTKLRLKIIRCSDSNSYMTARPRRNSFAHHFTCQTCNQNFTSKADLEKHNLTHNVYECKICEISFTQEENLERHLRENHNAENRFARAKSQPPERTKSDDTKKQKCPICDFIGKGSSSLYHHNKKYHSNKHNKSLPNLSDPDVFTDENQTEVKTENLDDSRKCQYCDFIARGSSLLHNHVKRCHLEKQSLENENLGNDDSLSIKKDVDIRTPTCKYCNIICKTFAGLSKHITIHTGRTKVKRPKKVKSHIYNCINCKEKFPNVEFLKDHILTHFSTEKHPKGKRIHPCIHCHKLCFSSTALTNHLKTHGKRKLYKCRSCKKICVSKTGFTQHLQTCKKNMDQNKSKLYACKICNKRYRTQKGINKHMRCHNGLKNDVMPVIMKKKLDKLSVKKITKNGLNLTCKKCRINFTSSELLKAHLKMHVKAEKHKEALNNIKLALNNDKTTPSNSKYQCKLCNEDFDKYHSYVSHKGWHKRQETNNKPMKRHYKCNVCKLIFSQLFEFKKHVLKHKKFSCMHCPKRFAFLGRFKNHLKTYHDVELDGTNEVKDDNLNEKKDLVNKSFSCAECNLSFPSAKRLRFHVLKHMVRTE